MRNVYPIVIKQGAKFLIVEVPDIPNAITQAEDMFDALIMAEDLIYMWMEDYEEKGIPFPEPSSIFNVIKEHSTDTVSLVPVDYSEYKKKNSNRAVKKNCTIPQWLEYEADKAGLNYSAILQSGLKSALGLI